MSWTTPNLLYVFAEKGVVLIFRCHSTARPWNPVVLIIVHFKVKKHGLKNRYNNKMG
jgi:hypothetical protein